MAEKGTGESGYFSSMFGVLDPTRSAPKVEKNPADIPKEELMQLCMKLNKRMQAMEHKAQEFAKKYKQSNNDRSLLIDLIKASLSCEVDLPENDSLDIDHLKDAWLHQLNLDRGHVSSLERELSELKLRAVESSVQDHMRPAPSVDSNDTREGQEGSASASATHQLEDKVKSLAQELKTAKMEALMAKEAQSENERLSQTIRTLRSNLHSMEVAAKERVAQLEEARLLLESERAAHEEDIVFYRMQLQQPKENAVTGHGLSSRSKGVDGAPTETTEVQLANARRALAAVEGELQRAQSELQVLREVGEADSQRVETLENELQQCKVRTKDAERNCGATTLLKAEQEALLLSLRRDLASALTGKEEAQRRVRELEEYRVKAEGQLGRLVEHRDRLVVVDAQLEESRALVSRLQTQLQTVETNYATKTTLLAAAEATCEDLRSDLGRCERQMAEAELRVGELEERVREAEERAGRREAQGLEEREAARAAEDILRKTHAAEMSCAVEEAERRLLEAQQEFSRKSSAARSLLSERESELKALRLKVDELKEEIASGSPSERKIFELAKSQAGRDAAMELNRDTRELAFQQVQNALAVKDLELARLQQGHTQLVAEVADLRRVTKREGVNMDYLKNVVLQYMSFPAAAPEKNALVPVLALLLQFSAAELAQVDAASKTSSSAWLLPSTLQVKEVKPPARSDPSSSSGGSGVDRTCRSEGSESGSELTGSGKEQTTSHMGSQPGGYQPPLQFNEV